MITHDVDEAILLSDRILLMTNGPEAHVAEAVKVDIPRPRDRTSIIEHENYYPTRNHLVDFLVRRSRELQGQGGDRKVTQVSLGADDPESPRKAVNG